MAATASADVSMIFPVEASLHDGDSVQAGFVGPGQEFDLIFSDNSGFGFEWDELVFEDGSLPSGWTLVSSARTEASLVSRIRVPGAAQPNFYVIRASFANNGSPNVREHVSVRVTVKSNLTDVSFSRVTPGDFSVVGQKVFYRAIVSNSSIASDKLEFSSTLPSSWFQGEGAEFRPNSVNEVELVISPQTYGRRSFSFQASNEAGQVVKSFSSELNVRPTLKGKFSSVLSGFPFFTFSLLPFQLFDSFLGFVLPV